MKYKPEIKRILYATDLGNHTLPVFRYALDLAEKYKAEVIMVHVVEPMTQTAENVISTYLPEEAVEEIKNEGMRFVYRTIRERLRKFHEEECEENDSNPELVSDVIVVPGKPSEEILKIAEEREIDLMVLGKSSRKLRGAKITGSTARRVNRFAKRPVLIVANR